MKKPGKVSQSKAPVNNREKTGKFAPGQTGNPDGRPRGSVNKSTSDVRAAISLIAQNNIGKFEEWLMLTAIDDPAKAASLFLSAIEYHIPKLGRQEITGADGGPVQTEHREELVARIKERGLKLGVVMPKLQKVA